MKQTGPCLGTYRYKPRFDRIGRWLDGIDSGLDRDVADPTGRRLHPVMTGLWAAACAVLLAVPAPAATEQQVTEPRVLEAAAKLAARTRLERQFDPRPCPNPDDCSGVQPCPTPDECSNKRRRNTYRQLPWEQLFWVGAAAIIMTGVVIAMTEDLE